MSDAVIFAENDDLVSIGDFERSLSWGAEIEFEWKGVLYGVIRYGTDHKITIYQCGHPETEKVCETAEEALEYIKEDEYVEVTPTDYLQHPLRRTAASAAFFWRFAGPPCI